MDSLTSNQGWLSEEEVNRMHMVLSHGICNTMFFIFVEMHSAVDVPGLNLED